MWILLLILAVWILIGIRSLYTVTSVSNVSLDGQTYSNQLNTTGTGLVQESVSVPAAKIGQLTTRTNNTTGTLTMNAGHGFTTGVVISLFWPVQSGQATAGQLTTVTVGTVSGNSVPITTLSGGVLPAVNSNITAMIPTQATFVVTGNNCQALQMQCMGTSGFVTLSQSGGTVITSFSLLADNATNPNYNYNWSTNTAVTNPIASGAVGLALFSHGDSSAAHSMYAGALYNS